MDQYRIIEWLGQKIRTQFQLGLLFGVLNLLAGLAILAITWGLVYIISLFALGPWFGYSHWICPMVSWIIIPLLFWGNATTSREYLMEYSVTVGTVSDEVVNFYLPGEGIASNVNPFAPDTIHSVVKMITDCLYTGPRVIMSGIKSFQRAKELRHFDVQACGRVIFRLLKAHKKLSFQEIVADVEGINPNQVFWQLKNIEGVIFLQVDPPGLVLTQTLRQDILKNA